MSQIILDDDLKGKLGGLKNTVEVWESDGRVVGQFVPQDVYMKLMYAWAKTLFTDEEIGQAERQAGPGKTLAMILHERGLK